MTPNFERLSPKKNPPPDFESRLEEVISELAGAEATRKRVEIEGSQIEKDVVANQIALLESEQESIESRLANDKKKGGVKTKGVPEAVLIDTDRESGEVPPVDGEEQGAPEEESRDRKSPDEHTKRIVKIEAELSKLEGGRGDAETDKKIIALANEFLFVSNKRMMAIDKQLSEPNGLTAVEIAELLKENESLRVIREKIITKNESLRVEREEAIAKVGEEQVPAVLSEVAVPNEEVPPVGGAEGGAPEAVLSDKGFPDEHNERMVAIEAELSELGKNPKSVATDTKIAELGKKFLDVSNKRMMAIDKQLFGPNGLTAVEIAALETENESLKEKRRKIITKNESLRVEREEAIAKVGEEPVPTVPTGEVPPVDGEEQGAPEEESRDRKSPDEHTKRIVKIEAELSKLEGGRGDAETDKKIIALANEFLFVSNKRMMAIDKQLSEPNGLTAVEIAALETENESLRVIREKIIAKNESLRVERQEILNEAVREPAPTVPIFRQNSAAIPEGIDLTEDNRLPPADPKLVVVEQVPPVPNQEQVMVEQVPPVLSPEQTAKEARIARLFAKEDAEIAARAERAGPEAVNAIRNVGEKWKKFPFKYKAAITVGLILTVLSGVAAGSAITVGGVALIGAVLRVLGTASLFVGYEKRYKNRSERKTGEALPEGAVGRHTVKAAMVALTIGFLMPKIVGAVIDEFAPTLIEKVEGLVSNTPPAIPGGGALGGGRHGTRANTRDTIS